MCLCYYHKEAISWLVQGSKEEDEKHLEPIYRPTVWSRATLDTISLISQNPADLLTFRHIRLPSWVQQPPCLITHNVICEWTQLGSVELENKTLSNINCMYTTEMLWLVLYPIAHTTGKSEKPKRPLES